MTLDLKNFAKVFAETLTPDDRKAFEKMLAADPKPSALWSAVVRSHVACLKPTMFIRTGDKELVSRASFDLLYNPLVNELPRKRGQKDYRDKAALFAGSGFDLLRASSVCYEPGKSDWNGTQFNMYRPSACTPLAETPELFLDHINYLIPDERERALFLDYLAWMVQHPDKKMQFALLMVGRKGTGKSWLSGLIQILFGLHNVTFLPKGAAIADRFDASAENKQAIFIDELVPDGKNDLVRAIKPLITSPTVWIERKGIQKFEVANRVNLLSVSNHPNALKIAADEREWLVIRANDDVRYTDDDGQPTRKTVEHYDRLFAMTPQDRSVTKEVRRVLHFLQHRDLSGFNGQSLAPITDAKIEVAEYSETSTDAQIAAALRDKREPFGFDLFTVADVHNGAFAHFAEHDGKSPKAIEAEIVGALERAGCRRVSNKQSWINGKPVRIWCRKRALARFKDMAPPDLARWYKWERSQDDFGQPIEPANDDDPPARGRAADFA